MPRGPKPARKFIVEHRDPTPITPETPHDARAPKPERAEYIRASCCPKCGSIRSRLAYTKPIEDGTGRIAYRRCKGCTATYAEYEKRIVES